MAAPQFFVQPPFATQLNKIFPLTGSSTLQMGYMIWDANHLMPGYGSPAVINYLYNPSTVSSDFAMSNASAQSAQLYPNPGDAAYLAIPISQTAQWSLMFDRTFEVQGAFQQDGLPSSGNNNALDASTLGVQADVMAFMQFTGMFFNNGNLPSAVQAANTNLAANSGIMMQQPAWALFGNSVVQNGLMFYGFISEWSVQYTHWTQYNVPMRCVISVTWTMLSMPGTQPPSQPSVITLPNGQPGPGGPSTGGNGVGISLSGTQPLGSPGIGGA